MLNGDAEALPQELQEGDVQHRFLVPAADDVAAGGGLSDDFHGEKEDRGVARLRAGGCLEPFEQAQSEVERVGAILFHGRSGGPVQVGQGAFHVVLVEVGADALLQQLFADELVDGVGGVYGPVDAGADRNAVPVGRLAEDLEILVCRQGVLQFVDMDGNDRDGVLRQPGVQEVVPQGEVQQFPFPDDLLVHLGLLVDDDARGAQLFGSLVFPFGILVLDQRPASFAGHPHGQRADLSDPGTAYVDEEDEFVVLQLPVGGETGVVESGAAGGVHAGRLHDEHLVDAFGNPFRQQGRVVVDAVREGVLDQPAAGEGVPFREDHDGVKAHRFEAADVEHGHVQTIPELAAHHFVHEADPLAGRLETGRYGRIGDSLRRDGLVQGGHLHLDAVGVAGLVLVQRRTVRPSAQDVGRLLDEAGDLRMVGRGERRQHLGQDVHATPFVECQDGNLIGLLEQQLVLRAERHRHGPQHAFRQVRQKRGGTGDRDDVDRFFAPGVDPLEERVELQSKGRFESDVDMDVADGDFAFVQDLDSPDDGGMVLLHGEVHHGRIREIDLKGHGSSVLAVQR